MTVATRRLHSCENCSSPAPTPPGPPQRGCSRFSRRHILPVNANTGLYREGKIVDPHPPADPPDLARPRPPALGGMRRDANRDAVVILNECNRLIGSTIKDKLSCGEAHLRRLSDSLSWSTGPASASSSRPDLREFLERGL
jgi:hypothetical protein